MTVVHKTSCSRLFSTPHLVKKESVVRSHRKSISREVISFARELIDVVDILTVVKIKSPDLGRSALVAERKICGCVVIFLGIL